MGFILGGYRWKEDIRFMAMSFLCASWWWKKSDLSITNPNTQEDLIQTPKKGTLGTLKKTYPEDIQRLVFGFSSLGMSRDFFCCWAFGTIQLGSLQYPPVGLAQLSNQLEKMIQNDYILFSYFPLQWFFNWDPYNVVYYNHPHISG